MPRQHAAFTLIELVVAIAVVAVGVIGLMTLILQSGAGSTDPAIRQQAGAIAQSYMDEILLKSYCDPDLSADCPADCSVAGICSNGACTVKEGSRSLYDDVCDYDGHSDSGAADQTGTPIGGLGSYGVSVSVDDAGAVLNALSAAGGEVVRVNVSVSHPSMDGTDVVLTGFRTNY